MLPYLCVLSFSLICCILYEKVKKNNGVGYCFFISLSFISLLLFASFRDISVGTDTQTYLHIWHASTSFSELVKKSTLFSEPGFDLLSYLTNYISSQFFDSSNTPFFMFISSLVLALTYSSIIKYSQHKVLSLFFFITLGFYTFHFNGARQAIAIALFLYSTKYILNGSLLKYLALVLIGFLVHKTMLICLPLYFIFRKELNAKQVILVVMCAVVITLSVTSLVDFASQYDQRYQSYAKSDFEGGGVVAVLFNTSLLMWLWVSKRLNTINDKLYDISLLAMLIAVCIGWVSVILSLNPSGILRLSAYFTQLSIFSLPMSVLYFKNAGTRSFVLLSVLIVAGLYFYLTTTSFSGLAPYKLGVDLPI